MEQSGPDDLITELRDDNMIATIKNLFRDASVEEARAILELFLYDAAWHIERSASASIILCEASHALRHGTLFAILRGHVSATFFASVFAPDIAAAGSAAGSTSGSASGGGSAGSDAGGASAHAEEAAQRVQTQAVRGLAAMMLVVAAAAASLEVAARVVPSAHSALSAPRGIIIIPDRRGFHAT